MEKNTKRWMMLLIGWVFIGSGLLLYIGTPTFEFAKDWQTELENRLALMMAVAILIERSVEVYLNSTGNNGPDRHADNVYPDAELQRIAQALAAKVGLALGLIAAFTGVRLMSVFGMPDVASEHALFEFLLLGSWYGIDVVISGGLLAGGATIFHEIAELLKGGLARLNRIVAPKSIDHFTTAFSDSITPEHYYTIEIKRTGLDSGTLSFNNGSIEILTTCWWDPNVKIRPGTYTECSATRMNSKTDSVTGLKRPGIFLPTAVAPDTGKNTIFIHEGKDAGWSDGCIVLSRDEMMKMWNSIEKNQRNVIVKVVDT